MRQLNVFAKRVADKGLRCEFNHNQLSASFLHTAKMRDYVNELECLRTSKCFIADRQRVNQLIHAIVTAGPDKLQVVSDFDRTITKQHDNGAIHLSSFGIFARCKTLPPTYLEEEQKLSGKYLPIELDPDIPFAEKRALMEEWWDLAEKLLIGATVSEEDIAQVVAEVAMSLRDYCIDFIESLHRHNIPCLIFSAGIGDVVYAVMNHFHVMHPNVKIISNFLERNQDGIIQGFKGTMINMFNKNELALKGTPYYEEITSRSSVLLMGDSIGDAGMADGLPNCTVLKIGFHYQQVKDNIESYQTHFDIVLEDDQTMNVVIAILDVVLEQSKATCGQA